MVIDHYDELIWHQDTHTHTHNGSFQRESDCPNHDILCLPQHFQTNVTHDTMVILDVVLSCFVFKIGYTVYLQNPPVNQSLLPSSNQTWQWTFPYQWKFRSLGNSSNKEWWILQNMFYTILHLYISNISRGYLKIAITVVKSSWVSVQLGGEIQDP